MHGLSGMAMWLRIPLMSGRAAETPSSAVDATGKASPASASGWHSAPLLTPVQIILMTFDQACLSEVLVDPCSELVVYGCH